MENHFRVSSGSHSTSVAGAIAKSIRDGKAVVLQAIGAAAVNQAVKAIAIARAYLVDDHLDIVFVPEFVELVVEGNERTSIRFHVNRPDSTFPRRCQSCGARCRRMRRLAGRRAAATGGDDEHHREQCHPCQPRKIPSRGPCLRAYGRDESFTHYQRRLYARDTARGKGFFVPGLLDVSRQEDRLWQINPR
jgi:stage V sporulation protein S